MSVCPRCRSLLTVSEYEGARVEVCGRCGGHWLRPEELKQIVDAREVSADPRELAAVQEAPPLGVPLEAVREDLSCPSCGGALEPFNYAGDSGIILERCRPCGGIWLDGGKLEQVQMVVEAAEQASDRDAKRFSGDLERLETREDARELRDDRATNAPLLVGLINRLLNID